MPTKYLPCAYPVLAVFFCTLPYLLQGYPQGDDAVMGLIRVKEFQLALADHQFPPYWAGNLYGGYGSPIFLFYAPLYMFVATLCYLLTGSIIGGSMLAITGLTVIGAAGMYLLVQEALADRSQLSQCAARIAVYLFVLNPYLISDRIIRIANSEFAALCLAPIAFYGLIRIKRDPLSGSLILAAGLALVILAHNLTAMTVMAMLLALSILLYRDAVSHRLGWFIGGGLLLGLLLAVFFWLPVLYYKSLTHTEQLTQGIVDFHGHFKPLIAFFTNSDYFSMGLLNLWILVKSAQILWSGRRSGQKPVRIRLAEACLLFAPVFIFLQTRLSLPLWDRIPYLALYQFPWRMMGPLAIVISILAGLLFPVYYRGNRYKSLKKLELTVFLLCTVNALPNLYANEALSEFFIEKFVSSYETGRIRTLILTSTEVDEYLPKSAKIRLEHFARDDAPLILNAPAGAEVSVLDESGTGIVLEATAALPVRIELKRWFFPDWKATVNGMEHPVAVSDNGLLSVDIPPGHSRISLKLHPPILRRVGVRISLVAVLLWTMLMTYSVWRTRNVYSPCERQ
ncbi:MAG: hypothetical protein ACU841_05070 [Gammaproteobacteria bacterium]